MTRPVLPTLPATLPAPRALLFDLDGTLIDSRADIAAAANVALAASGLGSLDLATVTALVGDGARSLVARVLAAAGDEPDEARIDEALAHFSRAYLAAPAARTTLLPGARRALELGLPCALVTNKPRDVTREVLRALDLEGAFVAVVAGGDAPLKPAPDGVLAALDALGAAPRDAWMIGDGPQDVLAGRAAGCFTVGVYGMAERARLVEAEPDHLVASLVALEDDVRTALAPR